jgi:adenylylsulfate kinase-like enzyme
MSGAAARTRTPTVCVFSGLPASGKTTLSQALARRVGAATTKGAR